MFISMELILLPQHTAGEEGFLLNSARLLCLLTSDYPPPTPPHSAWVFLHP